ncbi:MAG: transcriptional repressor LexA [Patescibacteria group bacterium]
MAKKNNQLIELKNFYRHQRRMPSYAELATLFGFASKNAAKYRVDRWIEDGVLSKDSTGKILPGASFRPMKILGTVEAGFPSPAEEENVDTMSLDEWLIGNKEASFMLRISGDSMIDAGIRPGDMVILERGRTPKSGEIVVAEVDHEWTIKFFEKQGSQVTLKPANKKYRPIVPQEELKVAGVVTAVIRKY